MKYCPFCNWEIVNGKCSQPFWAGNCDYVGNGDTRENLYSRYKEERSSGGRDPIPDSWLGEKSK